MSIMMPRRFISLTTFLPKGLNPLPAAIRIVGGVTDVVGARVGQSYVAYASLVEMLQVVETSFDWSSILHAHGQGNFAVLKSRTNLSHGTSHNELVWPLFLKALDHIDQLVCILLRSSRLLVAGRNIDGHEGSVEAAFPGPGVIEIATARPNRDVLHSLVQAVGNVYMGIGDQELPGQPETAFQACFGRHCSGRVGGTVSTPRKCYQKNHRQNDPGPVVHGQLPEMVARGGIRSTFHVRMGEVPWGRNAMTRDREGHVHGQRKRGTWNLLARIMQKP